MNGTHRKFPQQVTKKQLLRECLSQPTAPDQADRSLPPDWPEPLAEPLPFSRLLYLLIILDKLLHFLGSGLSPRGLWRLNQWIINYGSLTSGKHSVMLTVVLIQLPPIPDWCYPCSGHGGLQFPNPKDFQHSSYLAWPLESSENANSLPLLELCMYTAKPWKPGSNSSLAIEASVPKEEDNEGIVYTDD